MKQSFLIFVRFSSSKDDLMMETKFPLSTTSTVSQTVEAMEGKVEKVWGTFSTFLILGVLSHSQFF